MDNLKAQGGQDLRNEQRQDYSEHAAHIYRASSFDRPEKQIRLVTVKPGNSSDDIQCELTVHTLENTLKYPALSYRWGEPTDTTEILLDGRPFQVTKNLEAALRHYREVWGESELRMWIDAVCINQRDDKEKSHQVQKMGMIYRIALGAFVYLGEEADDSDEAIAFFGEFEKRFIQDEAIQNVIELDHTSEEWKDTETGKWLLETIYADGGRIWKAISNIFAREYWERCWVLQEVSLAKKITMSCGYKYHTFRQLRFETAVRFLDNVGWQLSYASKSMPRLPKEPGKMAWVRELRLRTDRATNANFPLFHLMTYNSKLLSWDPRDRVFSLLGLVRDPHYPRYLAEYTKSVEQIYREVARIFMTRQQQSDLLSYVLSCPQYREHCQNLPSWAPDFSKHDNLTQLIGSGLGRKIFTAAGSTISKFSFNEPLDVLTIDGFCFAAINKTSGPTLTLRPKTLDSSITPIEWAGFVDSYISSYATADPNTKSDRGTAVDIITRTIITDQNLLDHKGTGRATSEFYQSLKDAIGKSSASSGNDQYWLRQIQYKYTFMRHRQLITTSKGNIGLCTADAREGDFICILLGVRVPLILRREEDHYVILGDCYVDGIMDGEAIPDMEAGKFDVESFNIH